MFCLLVSLFSIRAYSFLRDFRKAPGMYISIGKAPLLAFYILHISMPPKLLPPLFSKLLKNIHLLRLNA